MIAYLLDARFCYLLLSIGSTAPAVALIVSERRRAGEGVRRGERP